jgi:prevent-host-death family protein
VTTLPLSEAKTHLARLLSRVEEMGEQFVITRSGRAAGVLLSVEEYEGLLETLEILADAELMKKVRRGLDDVEAGRLVGHDEVWG